MSDDTILKYFEELLKIRSHLERIADAAERIAENTEPKPEPPAKQSEG